MSLDSILDRFIGSEDYQKKNNLRTVLEEISSEMLSDHPHGVGLNNYNVVNSRPYRKYSSMLERWDERRGYYFSEEYYERNPNTENLYWMFLAETGYLGFAGLLIFLAYSLFVCLRNYHYYKDTPQGSFILGLVDHPRAVLHAFTTRTRVHPDDQSDELHDLRLTGRTLRLRAASRQSPAILPGVAVLPGAPRHPQRIPRPERHPGSQRVPIPRLTQTAHEAWPRSAGNNDSSKTP